MKSVELIILGTSSQFPTKQRNHSSIFLRFDKFKALFDCGEGTQRQMRILKLSPHDLNALFISHWHGDHTLGIGGILQSLSASGRTQPLIIHGPLGTRERIKLIMNTYYFRKPFEVKTFEHKPRKEEVIIENEEFKVSCFPLKHGIPTIGFNFITKHFRKINLEYTKKFGLTRHPLLGKLQKGEDIEYKGKKITVDKGTYLEDGKKISYVIDTKYDEVLKEYASEADLLICEATLSQKDFEKSDERNHMSTLQAAKVAREAKAKKLLLTHVSQRYYNTKKLLAEAKTVFKNASYAKDFDKIVIK